MNIKSNRRLQLQEGSALGCFTSAEMIWKKNVVPSLRLFLCLLPFLKKKKVVNRDIW